jgi:hypothetical protein
MYSLICQSQYVLMSSLNSKPNQSGKLSLGIEKLMKTSPGPLSVHRKPTGWIWNFQNFEIKNPKKLALIWRILIKTEFKHTLSFIPVKIKEGARVLKSKNCFNWFLLTQEHSGLILFTPCLFPTHSPPSHRPRRGISRSVLEFIGSKFSVQIVR